MAKQRQRPTGPDDGSDVVYAAFNQQTDLLLRKRWRQITVRMGVSAAAVFLLNFLLHNYFYSGGFASLAVVSLEGVAFLTFIWSTVAYALFSHSRRVLRTNPWVEWYGRVSTLNWFGRDIARVVVLAHPEWTDEEVRTVHPLKVARQLPTGGSLTLWAAGNPAKTLIVGAPDGSFFVRGARWWPAKVRAALKRTAGDA